MMRNTGMVVVGDGGKEGEREGGKEANERKKRWSPGRDDKNTRNRLIVTRE